MLPRIGFYVHYHGMGHKQRTEAILRRLQFPATIVSSRTGSHQWTGPTLQEVVELACDNDNVHAESLLSAGDVPALHFAPLWSDNITSRVARYTAWLNSAKPDLMVVDVSAEISMLTRLASIPQIVMRQHGDRSDAGHMGAYAAAAKLLAPFPEIMEDDITPDFVRDKTTYLDGFCNAKTDLSALNLIEFNQPTILVVFGRGGSRSTIEPLVAAAQSLPNYKWIVLGKVAAAEDASLPINLHFAGWVDNADHYIAASDIVVTAAGHNSVMEIGRARKRFIAIAEDRPFDEQLRKVHVLNREGLAVGLSTWPSRESWPDVIATAMQLEPSKWDAIFRDDGARQAAEQLEQWAYWSQKQRISGRRVNL